MHLPGKFHRLLVLHEPPQNPLELNVHDYGHPCSSLSPPLRNLGLKDEPRGNGETESTRKGSAKQPQVSG